MGAKLNAISLFSGIGGFELGLSDYCRTVLYCEADPHAQAVLLSRMAEKYIDVAPISTDVKELTSEFIDIPIDIIYGGFPCQDLSCAGKGEGLAGKRSGLFFEIMRLAKEVKPTFIFLENVPAIRTRGLARVIEELTEAGYDSRWCMLSAYEIGAPHKRERWFLLAYNNSNGCKAIEKHHREKSSINRSQRDDINGFHHPLANTDCERIRENTGAISGEQNTQHEARWDGPCNRGSDVADADISGLEVREQGKKTEQSAPFGADRWSPESNVGGVAHGFSESMDQGHSVYLDAAYWQEEPQGVQRVTKDKEQRVERIKRLGNAVVPLQVRTAFQYLIGALELDNIREK